MEMVPALGGCANGSRSLPDSPAAEIELSEDQRAFLECIAADEQPPTDAELDAMFAEDQRRRTERELEDLAAQFMAAFGEWLEMVVEADTALVEQQRYERIADAISA